MKKCDYCAKEISYDKMYCSDECEKLCNSYYSKRSNLQKLLSTANIIGTCLIAVGIFVYALNNLVGALMMAVGGFCVGLITVLLPTPTDNMIKKNKLHKAIKFTRIMGIVLLCFGAVCLVWALLKI